MLTGCFLRRAVGELHETYPFISLKGLLWEQVWQGQALHLDVLIGCELSLRQSQSRHIRQHNCGNSQQFVVWCNTRGFATLQGMREQSQAF